MKEKKPNLQSDIFWQELSQSLDMIDFPFAKGKEAQRHRLIGKIDKFLILFFYTIDQETRQATWNVVIRHSPIDPAIVKDGLRSDLRITKILGKNRKNPKALSVFEGHSHILLPTYRRELPSELAQRIEDLITGISSYFMPIPEGICENPQCHSKVTMERKLVLVNGMPRLLCLSCIQEIPKVAEENRKRYINTPANLVPGLIVGITVAILGGLVMAAVEVLLGRLAAILSLLVLGWIIRTMDKVGTKIFTGSLILALLLTFASVLWGVLLMTVFEMIRFGYPLSIALFLEAWKIMLESPANLFLSFFLAILGCGLGFWNLLSQRKWNLGLTFNPIIEIVFENY